MRKNLLGTIASADTPKIAHDTRADYARRGASRSMLASIEEMAENSRRMVVGATVVDLDPNLVDSSFVSDRLDDDEEDYVVLREAIRQHGQSSPILVRPHPQSAGRYMIVYGHRRTRVARELGVPVRAIIRDIEDIGHIILQGQENTARANLSFIEKALFAKKLLGMEQGKDTIKAALSIDDSLLSRMLSIAETVPAEVIEAIGAAKTVGRDRWEELKRLLLNPAKAGQAKDIIQAAEFHEAEDADRFNRLLIALKAGPSPKRKTPSNPTVSSWAAADNGVVADFGAKGKTFALALKSTEARAFGEYISGHLEDLYRDFKTAQNRS